MKIVFAFIVPAILVVALLFFMGYGLPNTLTRDDKEKNSPPTLDVTEKPAKVEKVQEFTGTIFSLLQNRGSWRCAMSTSVSGAGTNGQSYLADGKMRGDFVTDVPQIGNVQTHMLVIGTSTVYTWASILNQGERFEIHDGSITGLATDEAVAAFNQRYYFKCIRWVVQGAAFGLPKGMVFY